MRLQCVGLAEFYNDDFKELAIISLYYIVAKNAITLNIFG